LALGIGADTAIFRLFDAVRRRTVPIKSPQELADYIGAQRLGHKSRRNLSKI
jgi:hypothetical protein